MKNLSLVTAGFVACLSACSSGDGESSSANYNNSGDNQVSEHAVDVSTASAETAKRSLAAKSLLTPSIGNPTSAAQRAVFESSGVIEELKTRALLAKPTETETQTEQGPCGGEAVYNISTTTPDNEDIYPRSFDIEISFDEFCVGTSTDNVILDGSANSQSEFTSADSYSTSFEYDISYTSSYAFFSSGEISFSQSCEKTSGLPVACDSFSSYDNNGESYTLTYGEISGNDNNGYSFEASLNEEGGEEYAMEFDSLVPCDNGNFESGSIEITESDNQIIEVEFLNCQQMQITYRGETEVLNQ